MDTTLAPRNRNKASVVSVIAGILSLLGFCGFWLLFLGQFDAASAAPKSYALTNTILVFLLISHPIAALIAVIAGIVSLVQIKKSREAGKDYDAIGLLLGGFILGSYLLVTFFLSKPP